MVKRNLKNKMTPNKHIEEKIKEFEVKFFLGNYTYPSTPRTQENLQDFLCTALSESYFAGQLSVIEEAIKWINEKMNNLSAMSKTDEKAIQQTYGYKVAIDGLSALLKSKIKSLEEKQ